MFDYLKFVNTYDSHHNYILIEFIIFRSNLIYIRVKILNFAIQFEIEYQYSF